MMVVRRTMRLTLCALGLGIALMTSGCAQFVLLGLLLGGPPSIEPTFDTETGESMIGNDSTVTVVCYADPEIRYRHSKIDTELATMVARALQANTILVTEPDRVRAWLDRNRDWETADEIGREFKTDYVIELELVSFDLYQPHSATLFRGNAEVHVNVHKMKEDGTSERIFHNVVTLQYPTHSPRSTAETTELSFKRDFLSRLTETIGFNFYPSYNGDKIPWAT